MSSTSDHSDTSQPDWEITSDGLYIATRHFLLRRGYCCANRCRNCPYVNWREDRTWQHAPEMAIRRVTVSPKVLAGVRAALAYHDQALINAEKGERNYHCDMLAHYRLLLERWRS